MTNRVLQPIAYLSCEIKGRDFKSRLLIAAHLVKRGYSVVVGQHWNLIANAAYAPRGCYLFKTANRIQADNMRHCRKHGHVIIASDEEAFSTAEHLAAHTTDAGIFDHIDAYLALNAGHARSLEKAFPGQAAKICVSGTARADLLRAGDFARPHPTSYILINTSFGLLNSIWGTVSDAVKVYAAGMGWDLREPVSRAIMDARLDYEQRALVETNALIEMLMDSRSHDLVVRPHPSEAVAIWKRPGIHVLANSDPYPWIKHASAMVHNDSTIGLEAAILDAPALNLSPLDAWSERLNLRLFNETVSSAVDAFNAITSGRVRRKVDLEILAPLDAARVTSEVISQRLPPPSPVTVSRWGGMMRTDLQKEKITVSEDECLAATREIFPLAGARTKVSQLFDTVFLFQPS